MIITTLERGYLLDWTLARLMDLTLPDELIVVDDGGEDDTEKIVRDFEMSGVPTEVKYIHNNNPGTTICSLARNIGIRAARHDWIITTEPELVYVTDIVAQFGFLQGEFPDQVISAGHVTFAPDGWDPSQSPELMLTDTEPPADWERAIGWVAPHTALYKKEWLEAIGGWDETFPGRWGWDDTDLLTRLRISGHGQYIGLDLEAIHQWHGLGSDDFSYNEQHFLDKSFNQDETDLSDVVANQGHEWGMVR